jgi:hypothetical protein
MEQHKHNKSIKHMPLNFEEKNYENISDWGSECGVGGASFFRDFYNFGGKIFSRFKNI